eukprot:4192641-Lingulodinium_polyedra.AAC.1
MRLRSGQTAQHPHRARRKINDRMPTIPRGGRNGVDNGTGDAIGMGLPTPCQQSRRDGAE